MAKITVTLENGAIQQVEGIPPDIFIEVRNYDVSDLDEKMISHDERGRKCQIREWRASE